VHALLVQLHGMSVPPSLKDQNVSKMKFIPNFLLRDLIGWILAIGVLAALAALFPWELGEKADPFAPAPAGIKPEWYFLFMFQTLKYLPAKILGIQRVIEIGYPDPRVIGTLLTAAAIAWALWTVWRASRTSHAAPDLWLVAGVGAFCVHAYATLSAQVHENHLFAAVPLLVLASAGRQAFRPICAGVSAIVALNLNLFYGLGDGIGYALPRGLTIVDATVILALVNCFLLSSHAVVLNRECSTATARRRTPAPASIPAPAIRSRW